MTGRGEMVRRLENSSIYREFARAYSEATGLAITFKGVENPACEIQEHLWGAPMANSGRCPWCRQIQEKLTERAMEKPCIVTCPHGLCEMAVPVKLGHETIGFLRTGQVLRQKPTEQSFRKAIRKAERLGARVNREAARARYFNMQVASQKKIDGASHLLTVFAEHLAMKSNQIAVQNENTEPPVVAKAKEFIETHHTEPITLTQLARAVSTSVFYFCKLFKKGTGLRFTEYVARVRTEKAKDLLPNRNLRVSEIAYEVGFQSLTQFNRMFREIVGQSPTEYRARLSKQV